MAANFYWLGRYVERTENTGRLLEYQLARLVDTAADEVALGWRVVYRALNQPPPEAPADVDEAEAFLIADAYTLAGGLVEDERNPASMRSCWRMARENAKEIRPRLPLRVWVCLNRGYLWLGETDFPRVWAEGPATLAEQARDRLRLLAGVVDSTMARDDAWRFLELGRYVERLQQQIVLLGVWDGIARPPHCPPATNAPPSNHPHDAARDSTRAPRLSWLELLRVCGAFEAWRRDRSLRPRREAVLGFLVRNPEIPHSLRFAAGRIEAMLGEIDPGGARHPLAAPHRSALRLAASLQAPDVADFEALEEESLELHDVIMATYVDYPIGEGLPS